eukprot:1151953-Pelagomonas_calceolata.AAC.1
MSEQDGEQQQQQHHPPPPPRGDFQLSFHRFLKREPEDPKVAGACALGGSVRKRRDGWERGFGSSIPGHKWVDHAPPSRPFNPTACRINLFNDPGEGMELIGGQAAMGCANNNRKITLVPDNFPHAPDIVGQEGGKGTVMHTRPEFFGEVAPGFGEVAPGLGLSVIKQQRCVI